MFWSASNPLGKSFSPACVWFFLTLGGQMLVAAPLEFNRDIRPILSDKCFHCHGFDPKTREADLRLDEREAAVGDGHIVPGDALKSLIIQRVISNEDDEVMPPPKSKLGRLTHDEIEKLKQWVNEGAQYQKHWSFIAPDPAMLKKWQKEAEVAKSSPIDFLVSRKLSGSGAQLQPMADEQTLVRRLSFDLTGLPPTPKEVQSFVAASKESPEKARQDLVARLLASPAYGERMAVDWLDVARYADSYGFQVDRQRDVWMWRDWVVNAFNRNLPFDQFITWQVAGDLLPNATDEQILATAFNRLHQQESEGGSVEEEYRIEYVADRVQTFATAFLGLTFECSRCHDHKYDPIKQSEYYGLSAFFQNIDEAGLYSYFTQSAPTPALPILDEKGKAKHQQLVAKISDLEKQLGLNPKNWREHLSESELVKMPDQVAHYTFDKLDNNRLADELNPSSSSNPKEKNPAALLKGENKIVPGKVGNGILFSGDDAVETSVGDFSSHQPFSLSLWIKTPDIKERAVVLHRSRAWTDAASRGYELLIEEGRLKWSLIHFWPGNAISIRAQDALPINEWTHLVVTNDGSNRASGLRLYVNGKLSPVDIIRDHLTRDIKGGGGDNITLGERFRDRGFKGGMMDDLRVYKRDISLELEDEQWPIFAQLQKGRAELIAFNDAQSEIMVMQELPQPKTAYILARGEYDIRQEAAPPVTPAFLSPFPQGAPVNRLGLSQWITAPEHPLTARVIVNRLWQSLFGRGLVKTSEDFGSQGEKPLHPELLDYLALRLIESGWDMKALMTEIVSSQVYLQRSFSTPENMADDPENQWLARGPSFRLSAEMIRDNALATAGLLNPQMGGPPVNPYEMTEAFKPVEVSKDSSVYRRSLYTTWRRTSPPPAMVAFDAPRRAVCSAKRERTDSPLQALILLNGTQYVEAARVLAEKLRLQYPDKLQPLIEQAFLHCLSRFPDGRELEIMERLYHEQWTHFKNHPDEAAQLIRVGNAPHQGAMAAPDLAAVTVLIQALMNHDASVVKR